MASIRDLAAKYRELRRVFQADGVVTVTISAGDAQMKLPNALTGGVLPDLNMAIIQYIRAREQLVRDLGVELEDEEL